jgi:hypothetical protein
VRTQNSDPPHLTNLRKRALASPTRLTHSESAKQQRMSIVLVLTYVLKSHKQTEFLALVRRLIKFKEEHPRAFEGLESWRLLQLKRDGISGSYIEMWQSKNSVTMDRVNSRMMKYKEMKEIHERFHKIVKRSTLTESIWNTVA